MLLRCWDLLGLFTTWHVATLLRSLGSFTTLHATLRMGLGAVVTHRFSVRLHNHILMIAYMWIMSCWVAHSVCCRFATQGTWHALFGFRHIGDSNTYSNAMEMHSQECWLPADNGACVAAMTLKSQKTRPKFFQHFQSSNQHGTAVKSPCFLKNVRFMGTVSGPAGCFCLCQVLAWSGRFHFHANFLQPNFEIRHWLQDISMVLRASKNMRGMVIWCHTNVFEIVCFCNTKKSTKWRSWTITKHPNKHVQTRSNFRLDKPSLSSLLKHCSANWSASRCFLPGWPSVKTYPKWNTEDNALLMTSKFESIV